MGKGFRGSSAAGTFFLKAFRTSTKSPLSMFAARKSATALAPTYTYDRVGNRVTMKEANGNTTTYLYDRQYRLVKVTYPGGIVESFTYDAVGNRLSRTYSGATTTSSYDADNRLTSSSDGYSYTYDNNGNMKTRTIGAVNGTYRYDYENRLTAALTLHLLAADLDPSRCGSGSSCTANANPVGLSPSPQAVTLSLRAAGSVYLCCQGVTNTVVWQYVLNGATYNMGSRSFSYGPCPTGPTGPTGASCTNKGFDSTYSTSVTLKNGDTLYGEITFVSNSNTWVNTSVLHINYTANPNVSYGYSSGGLRTSLTPGDGSPVQRFGYDLLGLGGLPQVTGLYLGTSRNQETVSSPGNDKLLQTGRGGSSYYYHQDGLGSVTSLTDGGQNVVATYRYDAFGGQTQASGTASTNYRYAAREWDASNGLGYYRARYYDPSTGRFLGRDPDDGPNPYAYAGDNPVRFIDPSGHRLSENDPYCFTDASGAMVCPGYPSNPRATTPPSTGGGAGCGGKPSPRPTPSPRPANCYFNGKGWYCPPSRGPNIDWMCVLSKIFDDKGVFQMPATADPKDLISCLGDCLACSNLIRFGLLFGWSGLYWLFTGGVCLVCVVCVVSTANEIASECKVG